MFAERSSPEEWERRGDEIMLRSLYDVAAKCYAMAGATHKHSIAVAHQRALKASHLRAQPRQMRDAFLKAAILFLECHRQLALSAATLALRFSLVVKAGRCLQNARENHLAAVVFEKNGQVKNTTPLQLLFVIFWESSHGGKNTRFLYVGYFFFFFLQPFLFVYVCVCLCMCVYVCVCKFGWTAQN